MTHDKDCKYSHYPGSRRERQLINTTSASKGAAGREGRDRAKADQEEQHLRESNS
jgi:hypothetical protein